MNRKHNPWIGLTALLLLAVVLALICTGCNSTKKEYEGEAPKIMMIVDHTDDYAIYRHDQTGVHYFCVRGTYGRGVCVVVNADGTPYTGEKE